MKPASPKIWIAWLLAACFYGYEFLHRTLPSVLACDLFTSFHVSGSSLGHLSATYFYAYACVQIPGGMLLDRYGPRRILVASSLLVAFGSYLFGSTEHLSIALFSRFLIGLGSGTAFSGCLLVASQHLPHRMFPLLVGVANSIGILGALCGEVPIAFLLHVMSWRQCLIGIATIGMWLTLFLFLFLPRDPKDSTESPSLTTPLSVIAKDPASWSVAMIAALKVIPIISFGELWAIPYLTHGCDLSPESAATVLSFIFIGIGVGGPLLTSLEQRFGAKTILNIGGLGACVSYSSLLFFPHAGPAVLSLLLFCLGFFSSSMLVCFALMCEIHPRKYRGMALGFVNSLVMLTGAGLQPLIGLMLDRGNAPLDSAGVPLFTLENYQFSLSAVSVGLLLSLVLTATLKIPSGEIGHPLPDSSSGIA